MLKYSLPLLAVAALLAGCNRRVVVEHHDHHEQPAAEAPAPAPATPATPAEAAAPAPAYVEEGATVDGTTVVEPTGPLDYVEVNGGWYYWHPKLNVWVHAHRAASWHPAAGGHVYHSWAEHPMYRREKPAPERRR